MNCLLIVSGDCEPHVKNLCFSARCAHAAAVICHASLHTDHGGKDTGHMTSTPSSVVYLNNSWSTRSAPAPSRCFVLRPSCCEARWSKTMQSLKDVRCAGSSSSGFPPASALLLQNTPNCNRSRKQPWNVQKKKKREKVNIHNILQSRRLILTHDDDGEDQQTINQVVPNLQVNGHTANSDAHTHTHSREQGLSG